MQENTGMQTAKLTSIVLLAGFSTRMGQPKQHVKIGDKTFLEIIAGKLTGLSGFLQQMIFVGQSQDEQSRILAEASGGIWVNNPAPENGPLSSIRIAMQTMQPAAGILLWPVDHPMPAAQTLRQLVESWSASPESITVPSNGCRRGHPGIFPAWTFPDFFRIDLADGARKILQMYPDRINHLLTDDSWTMQNLNTPQLLAEAQNWLKQKQQT
jgi:molybdenum cofactor cytidylyltransferase